MRPSGGALPFANTNQCCLQLMEPKCGGAYPLLKKSVVTVGEWRDVDFMNIFIYLPFTIVLR